jgi:hypothetical protein
MMDDSIPREKLVRSGGIGGAVALGFMAVVVLALGAKFCLEWGMAWRCPMLAMLGVPCPSCGSTRAFAALAGWDFAGAVRFNPLIMLGLLGLPVLLAVKRWPEWVLRNGWAIFGTLVGLNWVYLLLFLPR